VPADKVMPHAKAVSDRTTDQEYNCTVQIRYCGRSSIELTFAHAPTGQSLNADVETRWIAVQLRSAIALCNYAVQMRCMQGRLTDAHLRHCIRHGIKVL